MAAYMEDVYSVLRAAILSVIPGLAEGGIWEGEDADAVPWGDMEPPLAAIIIPELQDSDDGGTANLAYECDAEIYYADEVSGGNSAVRGPLEALRDYFWTADVSPAQVLAVSALNWSNEIPPNLVFAEKGYVHKAGRLTVRLMVGEAAA